MKYKFLTACIVVSALCALFSNCGTLASIMDDGASIIDDGAQQVVGATGAIGQNAVTAVNNSRIAIASAAEEITPEQEYYIGRAVGAQILSTYLIWNGSPALTAYLNRICSAIVINSPKPEIYNSYCVMILDSEEINAFATSGGHIFVTRGLIASARSEDALASVIAHEIAHIQLQHSIKAIRTSRITQAIMITGASAAGAVTGNDVNEMTGIFNETVGDIVSTLVNNGYSQSQEFDADNLALSLLASAGYNPSGLIDMLRELDRVQGRQPGGFNRTHPTPARRLANAERILNRYRVSDTSSYRRARFEAMR